MKTKVSIYLKVICAFLLIVFCDPSRALSFDQPIARSRFAVKITAHEKQPAAGGDNWIHFSVHNISEQTQVFFVMSGCTANNWESDNQNVSAGSFACLKNALIKISLKPGEDYEGNLQIGMSEKLTRNEVIFRLKFKPYTQDQKYTDSYWSNLLNNKAEERQLKIAAINVIKRTVDLVLITR